MWRFDQKPAQRPPAVADELGPTYALNWLQVRERLPKKLDGEWSREFVRALMRREGGFIFARTLYLYAADLDAYLLRVSRGALAAADDAAADEPRPAPRSATGRGRRGRGGAR